ncbi:MAG: type II toxin-antitoxin system HipA family toxin [Steroidobacteraceae bacterium]
MKRLYVWVRGPDGTARLAGELGTTEPTVGGRFESEFEYAPEWSTDPDAFPLDPVSLPVQPLGRRFQAEQFHPPLSVFDDSLPDDWGRRLLARSLSLEGRTSSPPEMLLALQGGGPGALMFTDRPLPPGPSATPPTQSLSSLLSAATRFEAGTLPPGDAFHKLLEGSSRAGGARPKALVHDNEVEWLAKFPSRSRDGIFDVVGLEATCLQLARRAGLVVPDMRLQSVGRRRVLLVRRFDVTEHGGRTHMISMRTLCRERPGVYVTSYTDLALVLRKYSASPAEDVAALFRHMAFNAAVGNVDDHLKNFWMLNTPSGYRLAPAFDLVPDVTERHEHTLSFQYDYGCPTREILLAVAREWRVVRAEDYVDDVIQAVSKFRATAGKLAVRRGKGLDLISADVRRRVELLTR